MVPVCSKGLRPRLYVSAIKDSTVMTVVRLFARDSQCVTTEETAHCKATYQRASVTMDSTDIPVSDVFRSLLVPNVTVVLQTLLAGQLGVTRRVFMGTEQVQMKIFVRAIMTQSLATGMEPPATTVCLAGVCQPVQPATVHM